MGTQAASPVGSLSTRFLCRTNTCEREAIGGRALLPALENASGPLAARCPAPYAKHDNAVANHYVKTTRLVTHDTPTTLGTMHAALHHPRHTLPHHAAVRVIRPSTTMTIVAAHTVYTHASVMRIRSDHEYGCIRTQCARRGACVAWSCVTRGHDTCSAQRHE